MVAVRAAVLQDKDSAGRLSGGARGHAEVFGAREVVVPRGVKGSLHVGRKRKGEREVRGRKMGGEKMLKVVDQGG